MKRVGAEVVLGFGAIGGGLGAKQDLNCRSAHQIPIDLVAGQAGDFFAAGPDDAHVVRHAKAAASQFYRFSADAQLLGQLDLGRQFAVREVIGGDCLAQGLLDLGNQAKRPAQSAE